ncbi:RNA polymerase sigma factor [uncultured Arcticibacterium sp.]|uniref:RNA polymerase sigma factor n=1 Tax=uncultured Arcticibacterium sp. TaxID=2173042 RepID=UPI0030F9F838
MKTNDFKNRVLSLSERIFPMVNRLLGNSTTAQDATQEIMIKLWDKRKQIENHPNLTGFVFMTARNYCLDILKRKGPKLVSSDLELNNLHAATGQEEFEWNELTSIVEKILKQLPEQQRDIMTMRDIDGLEFKEIAEATGLKLEHVRVLLSRARKEVAASLKKMEDYGH